MYDQQDDRNCTKALTFEHSKTSISLMRVNPSLFYWLFLFFAPIALLLVIPGVLWSKDMMDDFGFEKMGKPKPGEWLFHFH